MSTALNIDTKVLLFIAATTSVDGYLYVVTSVPVIAKNIL